MDDWMDGRAENPRKSCDADIRSKNRKIGTVTYFSSPKIGDCPYLWLLLPCSCSCSCSCSSFPGAGKEKTEHEQEHEHEQGRLDNEKTPRTGAILPALMHLEITRASVV